MVDHLVGAVAGDGLNLTVGAASFQKVDGGVLTKAVGAIHGLKQDAQWVRAYISPASNVTRN